MKPYLFLFLLLPFNNYAQERYAIVIDEIMADPSPSNGLPGNEWIELKNISTSSINLQSWRIGDATSQSGPLPAYLLQPDSFLIICPASALMAMSSFGAAISVSSFPSLDNETDQLFLKASNGTTIHAVYYADSWYQNELKKEGGWSLEMIDPHNPCNGINNWRASIYSLGGSPGKKNSVDNINMDKIAPLLLRTYTVDDHTIIALFNETVDSMSASVTGNYSMSNNIVISNSSAIPPLFNSVRLTLVVPIQAQTTYQLSVSGIVDCANNIIATAVSKAGLPEDIVTNDIVINELLFNPRSNSEDYIEYYNNSNKIVDASKMYMANRNSAGIISNLRQLSATPRLIFPEDYVVATADEAGLKREYLVSNPGCIFLSSPPSMPDDKGTAVLLNQQGVIIDEVNYDRNWHFKLLNNDEGVALERISPSAPSQNAANWHSAASTAGYGTPTYKNSQYKRPESINATINLSTKIFSPDNDGRDDIAIIQYKMTEPGFMANIIVYDIRGLPVKNLVRNELLGLEGYWNWDGLNNKGQKLPIGVYIVLTELFNLDGKKERFKNVITLARKL